MNTNESSHDSGVRTASTSLLRRVKSHDSDAWQDLVALYAPLVYARARKAELTADDAADVVQDVFMAVAKHIDQFQRDGPDQGFRRWIYTICQNKIHDFYRRDQNQPRGRGGTTAHQHLQEIEGTSSSDGREETKAETRALRKRALELARDKFREDVWIAFWRTAIEGDKPADVAHDLGVTVWFVYKAKSRVLQRLRQDADELGNGVQVDR